jgi:hypothetical protein
VGQLPAGAVVVGLAVVVVDVTLVSVVGTLVVLVGVVVGGVEVGGAVEVEVGLTVELPPNPEFEPSAALTPLRNPLLA